MSSNDWGVSDETFCGGTPDDELTLRRSDVWTKALPTEDGYYWHRENIAQQAVIRYICGGQVRFGFMWVGPVATYGGEWFGPLQEPGGDAIENCEGN